MKINNQQKNNKLIRENTKNNQNGFTLVEALFAVFILTFAIAVFMGVVASSLFSARYARDEITADYLLQEVVDYIRKDRDTSIILQSNNSNESWPIFYEYYKNCQPEASPFGCYIDVANGTAPQICDNENSCYLYYNANPSIEKNIVFYTHEQGDGVITNFQRRIFVNIDPFNSDEINVEVRVLWKNGGLEKSKSLETSLLRWQ